MVRLPMPSHPPVSLDFPEEFAFGVSTSAHQFEGGNHDNNWAAWERRGKILTGDRCGRAADWWRNAETDFDLAQGLGLSALRLSVEWSRLEPREGEFPDEPVLRYRQMLEGLIRRGIRPMICLHHFTNPLWFEARGAFLADDAVKVFERFATYVAESFGDLCDTFITFNEANVYAVQGYLSGMFPPGRVGDLLAVRRVLVTMGRAHAAAYRAIKRVRSDFQIGFTHNVARFAPSRPDSRIDRVLAGIHEANFDDAMILAVMGGRVPLGARLFTPDPAEVAGTADFLGLNYYSKISVAFDPKQPDQLFGRVFIPDDAPQGDRGVELPYGEVHPEGLGYFLRRYAPLGKPIYVLEHGVPDRDDRIRPTQLALALGEIHRAIGEGVDVRGYYHWSLVDNFEWAEGWHLRFGLIAIDPSTQERRVRPSGRFYGAIAKARGVRRSDVETYAPDAMDRLFGHG